MAETTTTLTKHFSDPTKNGNTKHSFLAEDNRKYTTFKAEIAKQGIAVLGQPAVIEFTYQQNGEYENYYLNGAKPVNGAVSQPQAQGEVQQGAGGLVTTGDSRQASIERQTALKAATDLAAAGVLDPGHVTARAQEYFDWLEGKQEL